MGLPRCSEIDTVVYVDPIGYYKLDYADKPRVARLIGQINWEYREKGRHMMLMVPGRIGTSSPELGVPTGFSDISEFEAICEIQEKSAGYNPELSFGSHIFQDLVESEILYTAVFSDEKTKIYSPEKLTCLEDITGQFTSDEKLLSIVKVYAAGDKSLRLYNDLENDHLILTCG